MSENKTERPEDDDLRQLAYSAYEEAMSFGLSHETFLRYFKTIRDRAAIPQAVSAEPSDEQVEAAMDEAWEQIAMRGRLDVAVSLLRECIGPLEVSAALIESDDGEEMEMLIDSMRRFVAAAMKEPQ